MADQPQELTQQELFEQATAPEPAPQPQPEVQPQPQPEPPAPAVAEPEASIPSWRLREEAEARRMAEQRASMLEQRLSEIATHLQQQQPPKKDFFDDPDAAAQTLVMRTLAPYAEEVRRNFLAIGKMIANTTHGAEKVEAAEAAFMEAVKGNALDPADYERVVQSPNRYDAVVQWHKRQSVLSSVGDDPSAWFEKQLEAKMADPQFQAKLLERVRTGAAARPTATKLPPSLSSVTAAAGNSGDPVGDMSDQSLFAFATKS